MQNFDKNHNQFYQEEDRSRTMAACDDMQEMRRGDTEIFVSEAAQFHARESTDQQVRSYHPHHKMESSQFGSKPFFGSNTDLSTPPKASSPRILVLCDDFVGRSALRDFLKKENYEVSEKMFAEAFAGNSGEQYSAILVDIGTCRIPIETLLEFLRDYFPDIPVIIADAPNQSAEKVQQLKEHAFSYVVRPCHRKDLLVQIEYAVKFSDLLYENRQLKLSVGIPTYCPELYGPSAACESHRRQVSAFAKLGGNVLIQGAVGSGKMLTALQIHVSGKRAGQPFQVIHCDAMSPVLLDSFLFGHTKDQFCDPNGDRLGLMQLVHGGTLYFNRISKMPYSIQEKLSRYLKNGYFVRNGDRYPTYVDVQVIAGTNENLSVGCLNGHFLEELYYQLSAQTIQLPNLKDLTGDIPVFVKTLLSIYSRFCNSPVTMVSEEAMAKLQRHRWAGNFLELNNVIYLACLRAKNSVITEKDIIFEEHIEGRDSRESLGLAGMTIAEVERRLIIETLAANGGNRASSARQLGVSEKTIYNKSKLYKLKGML